MAVEMELKVRLDDPEPVKRRLSALGALRRSHEKSDVYWAVPGRGTGFAAEQPLKVRVRREKTLDPEGRSGECTLVTYKIKKIRDGMEINDEQEFALAPAAPGTDSAGVFEDLLEWLGLARDSGKEKQGWAWTLDGRPPVLAELSLVRDLGWFLELEIMTADQDERTVSESRNRLLSILASLDISRDRIEARPYTELLKSLSNRGH